MAERLLPIRSRRLRKTIIGLPIKETTTANPRKRIKAWILYKSQNKKQIPTKMPTAFNIPKVIASAVVFTR